jgi:hypothetical protein
MQATTDDVGQLYRDVIASLLALSNALEKANVLTKSDIAEAAQERLLALREAFEKDAKAPRLLLLEAMATRFERIPLD